MMHVCGEGSEFVEGKHAVDLASSKEISSRENRLFLSRTDFCVRFIFPPKRAKHNNEEQFVRDTSRITDELLCRLR